MTSVPQSSSERPESRQTRSAVGLTRHQIITAMRQELPQLAENCPGAVVVQTAVAKLKISAERRNILAFMVDKLGPDHRSMWWSKQRMLERCAPRALPLVATVIKEIPGQPADPQLPDEAT